MRRMLLIALLMISTVHAVDFDVSVFPSERSIKLNETALFEVELSHNSSRIETFEVYSNDVTWDIRLEKLIEVLPNKTVQTTLSIRPLNLNPGAYNLPVIFKRVGSNDQIKKVVYIEVQSQFPDDITYLPAVRGIATVEELIDPRNQMTIKLSLENQNRRQLDSVEVKVRSAIVNKDYSTTLGPLEKKTLTFKVDLNPYTPAQKDSLQISIIVPEQDKAYQFDLFPTKYEVVSYGLVVPTIASEKSFMKQIDVVELKNEGNKPLRHQYRVPAWFVKRAFVSGPEGEVVRDGALEWEISLEAGETKEITIVYNYRPILWALLISGLILGAYFMFRSPISVRKRALVVKTHEGGITEVKVVIELVNRGWKIARQLKVMDLTPHMTDVVQEFKETMLAPSKISPSDQKGTLVRWEIDMMEPKEHRILMYRMKTRLSVIGGMTLPVTAVHYHVDSKERESVSNKAEIRMKEV